MKFLKGVGEEKRKVRWSTSKKASSVFLSTMIVIVIFIVVISLFSWGIAAIIGS